MRACWIAALVACSPPNHRAGDASGAGDAAPADAAEGCSGGKSYIGCEYWAVDLQNAIEVLGPPQGSDCSSFGTTAVLIGALDVCVASDGSYAGRCDPGGMCPTGDACEIHATCALDAQHSPYAIVIANVDSEPADVTIR